MILPTLKDYWMMEKQLIMKVSKVSSAGSTSSPMLLIQRIKNVLKKSWRRRHSAIIDYVDVSYLFHLLRSIIKNAIHNHYWSLSEQAKLYYQIEGNRLDLISTWTINYMNNWRWIWQHLNAHFVIDDTLKKTPF